MTLTRAGCVVCVVDYPANSIRGVVQSDHPVPEYMLPGFDATGNCIIHLALILAPFRPMSTVLVSDNWNYLKQMQLK